MEAPPLPDQSLNLHLRKTRHTDILLGLFIGYVNIYCFFIFRRESYTILIIYFGKNSCLLIKLWILFFRKHIGCNHLHNGKKTQLRKLVHTIIIPRASQSVQHQTCLISHFSRSVILESRLRSEGSSCISIMLASTGLSGFLIASSPTPASNARLRLGFRSSPVCWSTS